jgi:hypothetical protein
VPVRFSAQSTSLGSKKKPPAKGPPRAVTVLSGPLVRTLLLAALAVIACALALLRHYEKKQAVPPTQQPGVAVDAGEIPVEMLEE